MSNRLDAVVHHLVRYMMLCWGIGALTVLPDVAGDALGLARGLAEPLPHRAEHLPQIILGACSNQFPKETSAQTLTIYRIQSRNKSWSSREQEARR